MEDLTGIHFSHDEIYREEEEEEWSSSEEDLEWSSSEEEESEEEEKEIRWPSHPHDLDSLPKSVLLDVRAFFDNRTNATTAYASLWKKHQIQVTLWVAHPPRVSSLTVHSGGVNAKDFHLTPMVLTTQGDLMLLRVTLGPHDRFGDTRYLVNYYVYKAGTKPSLTLLADASSYVFPDCSAAILPFPDGTFIVAAISWSGTHGKYDLHQFDSKTSSWSTRLMHVDKPERFSRIHTSKVLVIGGRQGLVAWVDLWNGILFCEVLSSRTILRYCPLPPALNKDCEGPPECVRDIAIVRGSINFFEMRLKVKHRQVDYNTTVTSRALLATKWKMMDPWQEWHKVCCTLDIFKIPVDKSCSELLSGLLRSPQGTPIALERFEQGHPALSLHDDDVVYIMAKTKEYNRRAIMLAVNLRSKVLQGVAKFDAKRTYGFSYTYLQSGISNHLTARSSVSSKGIDEVRTSQLRKYEMTTADSSRLPITQARDMCKGKNAADSSRRPITQAGDMCKGKNAADSSRRPITQAAEMSEHAIHSAWNEIARVHEQRLEKDSHWPHVAKLKIGAKNPTETGFEKPSLPVRSMQQKFVKTY